MLLVLLMGQIENRIEFVNYIVESSVQCILRFTNYNSIVKFICLL